MAANIHRVRCPKCRMWIDAPKNAQKVPPHKDLVTGSQCAGTGKRPAARRGPS